MTAGNSPALPLIYDITYLVGEIDLVDGEDNWEGPVSSVVRRSFGCALSVPFILLFRAWFSSLFLAASLLRFKFSRTTSIPIQQARKEFLKPLKHIFLITLWWNWLTRFIRSMTQLIPWSNMMTSLIHWLIMILYKHLDCISNFCLK